MTLQRYTVATFSCSHPVYDLQKKLMAKGGEILAKEFGESTAIHFDVSLDENHGDLTTSASLQLAKKLKKKPHDIAKVLVEGFEGMEGVLKVEIAGAGFVNITLTTEALLDSIGHVRASCTPKKKRDEPPTIVEYCSLNIAKPFGIHHILVTMIGQVLANLYAHDGTNVIRWNYFGDWGTQFGKLFVAFKTWGEGSIDTLSLDSLLKLYVKFHEEAEKNEDLLRQGQEAFQRLEKGDAEVRHFWEACVTATKRAVTPVLDRLSVHFDSEIGESHYEHAMAPILEEGKKAGVFTEGERGALIVQFSEESKLPPAVVLKSDGATNYLTRDLALVKDRVESYNPKAILHVVGAEQTLHFRQLMETAHMLEWTVPPQWEHISFGRMHFADKTMSTRKGNILKLEDALNEAVSRAEKLIAERGEKIQTDDPKDLAEMMGVGALVYGILSQNRKMDIVFDWDKMLTFEGNSAPYVQYTHARARSVLRKAGGEGSISNVESLTSKERLLLKLLLKFSDVLDEARAEHLPHKLTNYLYELCQAFNSFYSSDAILTAEGSTREARLHFTTLTAEVLKCGAELLTLRVPDRM